MKAVESFCKKAIDMGIDNRMRVFYKVFILYTACT